MKGCKFLIVLILSFFISFNSCLAGLNFGGDSFLNDPIEVGASKKTLTMELAKIKIQIEAEHSNAKEVLRNLGTTIDKAGKNKNILSLLLQRYTMKKYRASSESEKLFYDYTIKKIQLALIIIEEQEDTSLYPEIEKYVILLQKHLIDTFTQGASLGFEQLVQKGGFSFSMKVDAKEYGNLNVLVDVKDINYSQNKEDIDVSLNLSISISGENLDAIGMQNLDFSFNSFIESITKNKDSYIQLKNLNISGEESIPYTKEIFSTLKKIANEKTFIKLKNTGSSLIGVNKYTSSYSLQATNVSKKRLSELANSSIFNVREKNGNTYTLTPRKSTCKTTGFCLPNSGAKITLSGIEEGKYSLSIVELKDSNNKLELSYDENSIKKMSMNVASKSYGGATSKFSLLWDNGPFNLSFISSNSSSGDFELTANGNIVKNNAQIEGSLTADDPLSGYSQDARNSKVISDINSYVALISIKQTEGANIKDLIVEDKKYYQNANIFVGGEKLVPGSNYFIGTPNYNQMGIKKQDFLMPDGSEYIIAYTSKKDGKYEVLGYLEKGKKKITKIYGSYFGAQKEEIVVIGNEDEKVQLKNMEDLSIFRVGDLTSLGKVTHVSSNGVTLTLDKKCPKGEQKMKILFKDSPSLITNEKGEFLEDGKEVGEVSKTKDSQEEKIHGTFSFQESTEGENHKGSFAFGLSHSKYGSLNINISSNTTIQNKIVEIKAPSVYKEMDVSELNPYEAQLKKARDSTRIVDIKTLQMAVEQAYQDNYAYPKKSDFLKSVKPYLYAIPKDSLSGKVVNGCTFGYIYEVGPNSKGVEYGAYKLSTCLESQSNIDTKAKDDGGTDPLRYENSNGKFGKGKTEKFSIDSLK